MSQPYGSQSAVPIACLLFALALPIHAGGTQAAEARKSKASAGQAPPPPAEAIAGEPAAPVKPASQRVSIPARARRFKNPPPLKHLTYSSRGGFALRMVSNQEVTAEIRNGAGRTLAFTARTLEAGDWTLRPRNLAPGLYTVLLRTGPNLRALRLKIEDAERGLGGPEWVVEKASDSAGAPEAPPRGALLTE